MRPLGMHETRALSLGVGEYTYPLKPSRRREARRRESAEPKVTAASQIFNDRHTIVKRGRFWNVIDPLGTLVCVTVYKRGAREVIRRLERNAIDANEARL